MKKITIFFLLFLLSTTVDANHITGGEVTWRTDSLKKFIFRVKLYRNCNGLGIPFNVQLLTNAPIGSVICSMIQTSDLSPSGFGCPTCLTPLNEPNAVQEVIYESLPLTLAGTIPSSGWYFETHECCRDLIVDNLITSGGGDLYVSAFMFADSLGGTFTRADNSPEFTSTPTFVFCSGELNEFSVAASDRDFDSLKYEWANPLITGHGSGAAANYLYTSNYTFDSPLPGIFFNSQNIPANLHLANGLITFKSFTQGVFVICIKVSSWKCGIKTAEIYRDYQVVVKPSCMISINPPVSNLSPELSISKGGAPVLSDTLLAGEFADYEVMAIDFQFDSLNNPQVIQLISNSPHFGLNYTDSLNGCLVSPCATLLNPSPQTGNFGLSNTLHFATSCSNAGIINGCLQHQRLYSFTFKTLDNYCPVNGVKFRTLDLYVRGPEIIVNGNILSVSYPNATIQWYLNGIFISGATDSIFTPVQSGSYSAIVTTQDGCQLISDVFVQPSGVGLTENNKEFLQHIYVNEQNQLQIIINSDVAKHCRFDVVSTDGKVVQSFTAEIQSGVQHLSFALEGVIEGIYLLQTTSGNSKSAKKFYLQP